RQDGARGRGRAVDCARQGVYAAIREQESRPRLAAEMTDQRETMRALLSLVFCVLLAASASAQSFPSRPLRMLVPAPPAGITDLSARLVAEGLRGEVNQGGEGREQARG